MSRLREHLERLKRESKGQIDYFDQYRTAEIALRLLDSVYRCSGHLVDQDYVEKELAIALTECDALIGTNPPPRGE